MSDKLFKLSTDYERLWALLLEGKAVPYQVVYKPRVRDVGLIDKSACPHIPMIGRYMDDCGFKEWRSIEKPALISECKRLRLEFFDEIELKECAGVGWQVQAPTNSAASVPVVEGLRP